MDIFDGVAEYEEIPHGYRWVVESDPTPFQSSDPDLFVFVISRGWAIKWDCMIEFGMSHDHDPVECERMIGAMGGDDLVYEHYNNGIKEYY